MEYHAAGNVEIARADWPSCSRLAEPGARRHAGDAQRVRRPVLQRAPARSFRAAARRAERRERRLRRSRKDPAGGAPTLHGAHPDPLHRRRGEVLVGRPRRRGARRCRPERTGCSRSWPALTQPTLPADYQVTTGPASRNRRPPVLATPGGGFATGSAGTTGGGTADTGGAGGVMVSFQGAVGPFDAAVIKSDDSAMLKKWLTDNGYVISDAGRRAHRRLRAREQVLRRAQAAERRGREIDPADRAHVPRHRALRAAAADRDRRQPGHARAGLGALGQAGGAPRLLRDQDRRGAHRLAEPAGRTTSGPRGW